MHQEIMTSEEFIERYGRLRFGSQYNQLRDLQSSITPQQREFYLAQKQEKDRLDTETEVFMKNVKSNTATTSEYDLQQKRQEEIKSLALDEKIAVLLGLEKEMLFDINRAVKIRELLIKAYNPYGRKIVYKAGGDKSPPPEAYRNLDVLLKACEGIIVPEESENIDDMVYCGEMICGYTDGRDTYPLLNHCSQTSGFSLFFLQYRPLVEHCRDDSELREARKIKKEGKNVVIIVHEPYVGSHRFL